MLKIHMEDLCSTKLVRWVRNVYKQGGVTWNVPQAGLPGEQGLVGDPAHAASWLA